MVLPFFVLPCPEGNRKRAEEVDYSIGKIRTCDKSGRDYTAWLILRTVLVSDFLDF